MEDIVQELGRIHRTLRKTDQNQTFEFKVKEARTNLDAFNTRYKELTEKQKSLERQLSDSKKNLSE